MTNDLKAIGELPVGTLATIKIEVLEHDDQRTHIRLLPPYEGAAFLLADVNSKLLVKPNE